MIMQVIQKYIPVDTGIISWLINAKDLTTVYENANDEDQMFIQNLGLFFSAFLGTHLKTVELASASIVLPHNPRSTGALAPIASRPHIHDQDQSGP